MRLRMLSVSVMGLLAGACVTPHGGDSYAIHDGPTGASEVGSHGGFRPASAIEMPGGPIPTLEDLIAAAPTASEESEEGEDRLRGPAIREAALSYGARGGLAWASREINGMLRSRAAELSRIYDFERLLIPGPGGVMVLPPVIAEATEAWESFDAGKALRVADTVYEIVAQARFTPVAPLWQAYLVRDYVPPEPPPAPLLPRDEDERKSWRKWVTEGWKGGLEQAREIFEADLNRLERDFTGMVRYKALLEQGKVSPPVIAEGSLGVTGSGLDMRVNDRSIRITRDPMLELDSSKWEARPSALPPAEAAKMPPPRPIEPPPETVEAGPSNDNAGEGDTGAKSVGAPPASAEASVARSSTGKPLAGEPSRSEKANDGRRRF